MKGAKKPNRGVGKEQPHWRFVERIPGSAAAFHEIYGEKPTELPDAALAYPTIEQCFETWIECREPGEGGRFWWRSDGEKSVLRWIPEEKRYTARADEQIAHADLPNRKWEQNKGRLYVRLVRLAKAGYSQPVMISTGGINDITRIAQFLYGLWTEQERKYGEAATLEHYLVMLWRFEIKRADPGSGNRYPHYDIGIARSAVYMQSALIGAQNEALALSAGDNVRLLDVETGAFIDAEMDYADDDLTGESDPTIAPDRGKHPEFDGGGGSPEPEPPAAEKPKRTPKKKPPAKKPKPKAEPPPGQEPGELDATLFDAMDDEPGDENGFSLDYDPEAKAAKMGAGMNMNAWRGEATKLAEEHKAVYAPSGKADFPRILQVAGGLGYEKVGPDNLEEVMAKLREFAETAPESLLVPF